MTAEQQLPEGWKKTTLGEIATYVNGRAFKPIEWSKTGIPIVRIQNLNNPNAEYNYYDGNIEEKYHIRNGDLLFAWSASLGAYIWKGKYAFLNQHIFKVLPKENIDKTFIYYLLDKVTNELYAKAHGSGMVHVTKGKFEATSVNIPPFETQQAIVNKIESLFDEIDEGIGRLKTAAQQIQQYRQSLLKNAFNGELTKEWRSKHADALPSANELLAQIQTTREQHHAQQLADWQTAVSQWEQNGKEGKKPSKPKAPTQAVKFEDNFADLPSGWGAIKINQVAEIFTGATPLKSNANYYENGSIPWVTSGSLNNEFVDSADSFVTDLALKETNLKLLPKHTLLVAMYGEGKTRGKCSELLIEATTNQAIAGIVLNEKYPISRKFLKFYMFKNYADIRRQSSGGVQPNLNLSLVGNIIFPLPCLAEQTQIVAILESKLTACDQLAAELAKQLKQAELLKQAVLKAAFSGNLLDK
ncbi:TPA: restriction endonuclease subunit S [Neisseria subflava]